MLILSTAYLLGLILLAIAIAGWLHIGCPSCETKV